MGTKKLFYKSIIWQALGFIWISVLSYFWYGNWINSLTFSIIVITVSIFLYVIYEKLWNKFFNK